MSKKMIQAQITGLTEITTDIYSMWIKVDEMASSTLPGQFVSLYITGGDLLLPRPISVCEINREEGLLRLVFRVVGNGTQRFAKMKVGESISVLGPLGNGFTVLSPNAVLVGGGIGIPPMLELAKQLPGKVTIVLGYRDAKLFLKEEFEQYGEVIVSTEDGSVGTKGNVVDAMKENQISGDVFYSCGPTPMLRGVKVYGEQMEKPTYLSMEERMACGIGACLACTCKSVEVDHHTLVHNKRVCKDGPVFLSTEVEL